jgi:hypothetical protein
MSLSGTPITSFGVTVLCDWNADGNYEDVIERHRLKSLEVEFGRSVASALFGAANIPRCVLTVETYDRRYVPWYTGSPLYPNVSTGARIIVSVQFNSNSFVLFTGYVARVKPSMSRPTEVEIECEGSMSRLARTFPVFPPYRRARVPTIIDDILSTIPGLNYFVDEEGLTAEVVHYAADGTRSALEIIRELERIGDGFFTEFPDGKLYYFGGRPPKLTGSPLRIDDGSPNADFIYREMQAVDETFVTRMSYGGVHESKFIIRKVLELAGPFAIGPQESREFGIEMSEGLLWSITGVELDGVGAFTYNVPYNDGSKAALVITNASTTSTLVARRLKVSGLVLLSTTRRGVAENTAAINRLGYREVQFDASVIPYYTAKSRAEFMTDKYAAPYPIIEVTFDGLVNAEHARLPLYLRQNDVVYFGSYLLGSQVLPCYVEGFRVTIANHATYRITYTLTKYVNQAENVWYLGSSQLGSGTRLWYLTNELS